MTGGTGNPAFPFSRCPRTAYSEYATVDIAETPLHSGCTVDSVQNGHLLRFDTSREDRSGLAVLVTHGDLQSAENALTGQREAETPTKDIEQLPCY